MRKVTIFDVRHASKYNYFLWREFIENKKQKYYIIYQPYSKLAFKIFYLSSLELFSLIFYNKHYSQRWFSWSYNNTAIIKTQPILKSITKMQLIIFCEGNGNRTKTCLFGQRVGLNGTQDWFSFVYISQKAQRKWKWLCGDLRIWMFIVFDQHVFIIL